jgi:hypothetical protein
MLMGGSKSMRVRNNGKDPCASQTLQPAARRNPVAVVLILALGLAWEFAIPELANPE